jgi:hypothetical protein
MAVGASQSILLVLATLTLTEVRKIMATLNEIKGYEQDQSKKLDLLSQDLSDVSRKVDVLIAQGSAGGGIDQVMIDQIATLQKQVTEQIVAASKTLTELEAKVDSVLGPHPEPVR